jgi:hypothetical protein
MLPFTKEKRHSFVDLSKNLEHSLNEKTGNVFRVIVCIRMESLWNPFNCLNIALFLHFEFKTILFKWCFKV